MIKSRRTGLILEALLILILTLALFTGCNGGDTDSDSETDPPVICAHENYKWVLDTAPTCSAEGSKHKECITCGENISEESVAKISHTPSIIEGKKASCSESGLTDGKKCSVCVAIIVAQTEIAPIPHKEIIVVGKSATCTEKGLTEGKKCSVCNLSLVEQTEIPAHGHIEVITEIIFPTRTESGLSQGSHCAVCDTVLKAQENIPALGDSGECVLIDTPEIPASCLSEGITAGKVCLKCQETESGRESIEKIAHTEEILPGVASTCTAFGQTEGKKCSVCKEILKERTTLAKSDHIAVVVLGKDATCDSHGVSDHKICAYCNTTLSSETVLLTDGHNFSSGVCTECGKAESYGIFIVDGIGTPINNVFIKVMKNGEQVKLIPYNGKYVEIDLPTDTYTLEIDLSQLEKQYIFDESLCVLTPEKPSASIKLYHPASENTPIFVGDPISKDYDAFHISEGSHKASLAASDYTFFIFRPSAPGVYSISCETEQQISYSYHGSTFFVQGNDLSEGTEDIVKTDSGILVSVYADNMGGDYVIALRAEKAEESIINVKNIGEPAQRVEDEPWIPYLEDQSKVNEQLSLKGEGTYTPIDVTDLTISAVFNGDDGYYHLNSVNGPIIYIDLTTDTKFISSIKTICAHQRMGTMLYDVNGKLIEKRSYNELFVQYGMPTAENATVSEAIRIPLTAKLAEAIKNFGNQNHWWDPMSEMNIFTSVLMTVPYNSQYAWLLYCGYYK